MSKDRFRHRGAEDSRGLMRRLQSLADVRKRFDGEAEAHTYAQDTIPQTEEIVMFPQSGVVFDPLERKPEMH